VRPRSVNPILNVSSFRESVAWFEKLGWTKGWEWCAPGQREPSFGGVSSGNVEIFLCLDGQGGRGDAGMWLSLWVDNVDAVHEVCVREGLDVPLAPQDEPWGVREMHLRHPDGHVFRISQPSPHEHDHEHPHDHGDGHEHTH
jgi:hypothetical protein